jgi:hypothetical protein
MVWLNLGTCTQSVDYIELCILCISYNLENKEQRGLKGNDL